jgi:hypothetical protein
LCDLAVPPSFKLIPSIPNLTAVIKGEKGEIKVPYCACWLSQH